MTTEETIRKRLGAFIPHSGDEDRIMDGLGFWEFGAFRGEWSGTATWLADAPLPSEVPESMIRALRGLPQIIAEVRVEAAAGTLRSAVLLAPVVNDAGFVVLPVQGENIDVDPNFVAHIERVVGGGEWVLSSKTRFKEDETTDYRCLVYVVDGVPRAIVAPCRRTMGGSA